VKIGVLKHAPVWIAAVVIAFTCVAQSIRHDFIERLERMTFDWRVRLAARHSPVVSSQLGFVYIDDDTIDLINNGFLGQKYGLYWPRHIYGRVIRELQREGASVVAFDILFGGLRPDHAPVFMADGTELGSDAYLALQMKLASNVVIASTEKVIPPPLFRTNALALGDISAEQDADGILRRVRAFHVYHKWNRVLQALEDDPEFGVNLSQAIVESNKIILPRAGGDELPPVPLYGDGNIDLTDFVGNKTNLFRGPRYQKAFTSERRWTMGIVLAAHELGLDLDQAKVDLPGGKITFSGTNGVKRILPVDKDGYFYIDWCLPVLNDNRLTKESFEALLGRDQERMSGDTNRYAKYKRTKDWRGKLVMIGSSATGNDLTDHGPTPLEKDTLLVSEHWNVANSILTGRFIHKSSLPIDMFLIIVMGILAAQLTWSHRGQILVATAWIFLCIVFYLLLAVFAYVQFRYWVPLVLPLMGSLLVTHFSLLGYLVLFEQAERRRVRSVFTKVVSPDVVTELLKTEKLSLEGAKRTVTVFFSDIRGFTEMTDVNRDKAADYIRDNKLTGDAAEEIEDAQARETLATVNLYLKVIADVVLKHGGTVDKFIGDCVMAFWGAPVQDQHHALHCVRAAVDTQRAVYRLNQEREAENRQREGHNFMLAAEGKPLVPLLPILVVGTGINTGSVTVGLMGSDERVNYTVFGREVNLASRLETVSGRARVIISEATLAEIIQDDATLALSCLPLPPEKVKGIRNPVRIYEVPWREADMAPAPTEPKTEAYNTGYFNAGDTSTSTSDTSTTIFR
jgi:class 3 adenylate cyclase